MLELLNMSTLKPFIFGGIASLTAEVGTFPLDTTKTRLQVQGQVVDVYQHSRYRGMLHALTRIPRDEGLRALYRGIAPALLRQASYGTLKIGLYQYFKKLINPKSEAIHSNLVAGVLSGAISSAIANPTDVLKVRMQTATSKDYVQRSSCLRYFQQIHREEGMRGLYRGVGPTAQRGAIIAGVLLPSYDFFKHLLLESGVMRDNTTTHFTASFFAGVLGTAATNPIDVIKSRMMNQQLVHTASHTHIYSSALDCLMVTLRTEGLPALYKGFFPAYLRLGPWNIIFFITYEKLKIVF